MRPVLAGEARVVDEDVQAVPDETMRERLLRAAAEVFNQKGYAAASVREIVEAAGVTKPVLYYYYQSKEGIYLALLEESLARFTRVLAELRETSGTVRERITTLSTTVYALFRENKPVVRLIHGVFYGPPQGAPPFDFDRFHDALWGAFRELVEEGIEGGELRAGAVDVFTLAVHGAANICMEAELANPDLDLGEATLRQVLDAVFDGLLPSPSR